MEDTMTAAAGLPSLEPLLAFVLERAEKVGAAEELLSDLKLVLEEILTNIFFYAYPNDEGRVAVDFSTQADGELSIRVTDWGIPFNPLTYETPELELDFSERELGGMGIYLARRVAHKIAYQRTRGANRLTVVFRS
jgi:anti-sigma regulatory factor (Ser/Thr protein kinase)